VQQLEKNSSGGGHLGLIEVERAVRKEESPVKLVEDQWQHAAANFILDATVAEGVKLLAVTVQVEEEVEAVVGLQLLKFAP